MPKNDLFCHQEIQYPSPDLKHQMALITSWARSWRTESKQIKQILTISSTSCKSYVSPICGEVTRLRDTLCLVFVNPSKEELWLDMFIRDPIRAAFMAGFNNYSNIKIEAEILVVCC